MVPWQPFSSSSGTLLRLPAILLDACDEVNLEGSEALELVELLIRIRFFI